MRLKIYRGASVTAAMAQVRTELGSEALILGTRRSASGVEVTAALEPAPAPRLVSLHGLAPPPRPAPLSRHSEALRWHGVPATLAARLDAGPLAGTLAETLRFEALDLSPASAPLLLAGPPGAGKTLTVVRLATRLVLEGAAPMIVSTDEQRAGAAEQLAAFAGLLGLEIEFASGPAALAQAFGRRQEGQAVLIDTAGIDPFSPGAQAGIAALAAVAGGRIALALPAGLDPGEAADVAAAFHAAGARWLVATRMDAARRLGGIVAAAAAGLALTEAGIGPGAADGLAALTPEHLASRLCAAPCRREA